MRWGMMLAAALLFAACDDGGGPMDVADAAALDGGADGALADADRDAEPMDAAPDPDGAAPDAGPVPVPNIAEVLAGPCPEGGAPSDPPNSLARGDDLHRVTLDHPEAVCNDGTPAVIYIRRAPREAAEGRWVFHLQGGGGCSSHDDCRARWCGRQGIYDASKMSSRFAPEAIGGKGIFQAVADNRFNAANHVFAYYCSSDSWVGQGAAVLESESRPGQRFSVQMRGHSILEAMVAALRAGGVVSDDAAEDLPDLDDAELVLWSGVSAGSSGAQHNMDWFAGQLSAQTRVVGVFDAGFRPTLADVSDPMLAAGLAASNLRRAQGLWADIEAFVDTSCLAMHADEPHVCVDTSHTRLHHITTPFFQRADLSDRVGAGSYTDNGVPLRQFAEDSRATLARYPDIEDTAEEAAAIDFVPGVYGPNCGQHVGITNSRWFSETTVAGPDGSPVTFHDALVEWMSAGDVHIVDTVPASRSVCGPVDDDRS